MKYVLYEGGNGDILFTKEESVNSNPKLLDPFTVKTPTWTVIAEDDNSAVMLLNAHLLEKHSKK